MADQGRNPSSASIGAEPTPPPGEEHPRGTLALVGIYGFLFALAWLVLYLFVFLPRGTVTP